MRWVKRILVVLSVIILGLAAFGVYTVRNSFPQTSGELQLGGLDGGVEVLRDHLGVPHIYAPTRHDLFFTQGFTHAQDRFWQMDFWRHIGAGRLAEMFGESQVETDMFLRSLGFEAIAREEWESLGPEAREIVEAYAEGVNAYLDTHAGSEISLEYAVLGLQNPGYEIEPWEPVDTLIWPKVMAWDLGANMEQEIARAVLGRNLTPERVEQLFPPMPQDRPVIVEGDARAAAEPAVDDVPEDALTALARITRSIDLVAKVTGGGFEGIGSNNWVAGGSMTASGLPLLANDTHLGIQMPSIWYENGLHCTDTGPECGFDVVGFSFPGTPTVVIGHNEHVAWGVTNQAADAQDLYIERVNPDDSSEYEADGEWVPFEIKEETIEVAGGDAVTYEVARTRHGPVISETFLEDDALSGSSTVPDAGGDHVVALAWRALDLSRIIEAFVGINLATNHDEFAAALTHWDIAPQNLIYADVEGNIAYFATGDIPVRAAGAGRYPAPGWTSDQEWTGFIPDEEMPRLLNPSSGYIQTANQAVLRPGSTPFIGSDSAHGYRGGRIAELLTSRDSHDVASMQEMQMDGRDGGAEFVVPHLLAVDPGDDDVVAVVQERLVGWSTGTNPFQASGRSSGAAVYQATWRHLLANTFHDELPEDHWPEGGSRWFEVMRNLLARPADPFWDDVTTDETETTRDILVQSMRDAHAELTELLGNDPASWTWGDLHVAHFENQTLGQSGIAPVEWLFNRTAPARVGGTESVVNAVGWSPVESYAVDWLPSQRMVVDLSDLDASTFIHTTGQSGHAFHPDYASMIEMWVDGEHGPMPWSRDAVESIAVDRLVLTPPD